MYSFFIVHILALGPAHVSFLMTNLFIFFLDGDRISYGRPQVGGRTNRTACVAPSPGEWGCSWSCGWIDDVFFLIGYVVWATRRTRVQVKDMRHDHGRWTGWCCSKYGCREASSVGNLLIYDFVAQNGLT
jgi:hypothetical protein